jgi:hypothetical protein
MTVFFDKKANTAVPVVATNDINPATGNQSPLWEGITRDIAAGSYTPADVAAGNLLNRAVGVDSINRITLMQNIFEIPIKDADIPNDVAGKITYIKIPFSALGIENQQLYGVTILGYKKAPPLAGNYDFIAAAPHYALAPAAADTTDKVPVRIIDSVQSDREKITIKISVPINAGQMDGVMTRAMMRSLLVGNYIVLSILTSK